MIPEIILGPPGCGKTHNLLDIVEQEIASGTPPDEIGLITFTRKGAAEAVERACAKFRLTKRDFPYFSTIHAHCFKSLGLSNGDVLEGKKMQEFGDWLGVEISENRFSDEGSTFGFTPGDRALFMENLARVRNVPLRRMYDENDDGVSWDFVDRVARGLKKFKQDRDLIDFTDMLEIYVAEGRHPGLEVLLVDETQDSSWLQHLVIQLLATGVRRLVYAGDDDQAIYNWAGAAVSHFIDMPGTARVLDYSWRVPRSVQALSDEVIGRVSHRRPKVWRPRDADGVVDRVQKFEQVDIRSEDTLILGRNAYILKNVMRELESDGIVYEWRGHSSVRQSLLEAIQTWERLRKGESVLVEEVGKVYDYMSSGKSIKRGFKTLPGFSPDDVVSLEQLRERGGLLRDEIWHEAMDMIEPREKSYLLRARKRGESLQKRPKVRVSTIHGAKGGQADHVVLIRDMAARTHAEMRHNPEDEHRVWYVGLTRTKEHLTIVQPRTSMSYNV
jgi:DNA helicase II / ATP-dependent DNA helicase PcrA